MENEEDPQPQRLMHLPSPLAFVSPFLLCTSSAVARPLLLNHYGPHHNHTGNSMQGRNEKPLHPVLIYRPIPSLVREEKPTNEASP